ncbi:MAG: alpha-amylase family glycosyl hydrolase [Clostridia bacterium]|nr:alpha-amylase family glycosyl hydrolase [Clostridia bacterium]
MNVIHNAFLEEFRFPIEPITVTNSVRLRIAIEKEKGVLICGAYLCYNLANRWDIEYVLNMEYESEDNEYCYYTCNIGSDEVKTVYYYFSIEYTKEENGVKCNKKGIVEKDGDIHSSSFNQAFLSSTQSDISKWELLFYDDTRLASVTAPDIYYSIFPDRFYRSEKYVPELSQEPLRLVHENWKELPVYLPDQNGIIQNNDFFLGNLQGVIEKMDYLDSLSVTIIYMNPIFYAKSNHRYDTLDYLRIDPFLGNESDFYELCKVAHSHGKKVIIDFVPNHVSSSSFYAKKYSRGTCWWGIKDLEEINLEAEEVVDFFLNKVIPKWLDDVNTMDGFERADGIRCDVADEYPLSFILKLFSKVKSISKDKLIIFEVWEHASNKYVYGGLRNYFEGNLCDSVMNYELKNAILSFVCDQNAKFFENVCRSQIQTYPKEARNNMMNIADTHDSIRLITAIGNKPYVQKGDFRNPAILAEDRKWQVENMFMSSYDYRAAVTKLKLFAIIQYTVFGNPVIYYGTEVGMEGYLDPTNRRCHIFENGDEDLLDFYKALGKFRTEAIYLASAKMRFLSVDDGVVVYERYTDEKSLIIAVNVSNVTRKIEAFDGYEIVFGVNLTSMSESLSPNSAILLEKNK